MDLTERQLGRIEACLWGIEEATRNTNQTAYRLAKGIAEQLQEAESEDLPEEDFRADAALDTPVRVPDWRDDAAKGGSSGDLTEAIREFGRDMLKQGVKELPDVIRGIVKAFGIPQKTLGVILGIKPSSMCRIMQGRQKTLLLCRMAEFFGDGDKEEK